MTTKATGNSDALLRERVQEALESRRKSGLDGLTGDLEFVVINTEPDRQQAGVEELLRFTGYACADAFETDTRRCYVLTCPDSATLLVRSRLDDITPFRDINRHPKSAHLPQTRLETLAFRCFDLSRYHCVQRSLGRHFMSEAPVEWDACRVLQTAPSRFTGNSIGLVEWHNDREKDSFRPSGARAIPCIEKPALPHLNNISTLDHIATRVRAEHRDPAILEFMGLTDYNFAFAIFVPELNSITNVARCEGARFALVFTSGILLDEVGAAPGPTEQFVRNYGARVHHLAFITREIADTDAALRADGLGFLSELVGSVEDGIQQSFSAPSPHTLLVNEYIQRHGDFDGFFTQENVSRLTLATAKQ